MISTSWTIVKTIKDESFGTVPQSFILTRRADIRATVAAESNISTLSFLEPYTNTHENGGQRCSTVATCSQAVGDAADEQAYNVVLDANSWYATRVPRMKTCNVLYYDNTCGNRALHPLSSRNIVTYDKRVAA
jgi:hypothetical protein